MSEATRTAESAVNALGRDELEFHLDAVARRVISQRGVLVRCTLAGLVLGLLVAYLWPVWYQAQAVFLPPNNTDVTSNTIPVSFLVRQDPSDMYLGMLTSRSVADDVVDHVGLMSVFHAQKREDARATLASRTKFTVDKNSLIAVSVSLRDPKLAATIANAYLDALYRLNGAMAASGYKHREEFFEQQVEQEKEALAQAEAELKQTQEKTGVVLPEGEAMAGLTATAQLQAEAGAVETRLAELRLGGTDNNPEVIQQRTRLAGIRAQLARQQANKNLVAGGGLASTAKLPGLTLDYARRAREVKLREGVYNALTQQYEKARIASSDPGPQLQIVDRAVVPERKAGPPRKLIVATALVLSFLCGLLYVLFGLSSRRFLQSLSSVPPEERVREVA